MKIKNYKQGGEKMEIRKISEKINFDVKAQDCSHKEYSSKGGCKADCKKTRYVNMNAYYAARPEKNITLGCYKETYYTCSWSCKL